MQKANSTLSSRRNTRLLPPCSALPFLVHKMSACRVTGVIDEGDKLDFKLYTGLLDAPYAVEAEFKR